MVTEIVQVNYLHHNAGAISFDTQAGVGFFEYAPAFVKTGIELAPLTMPLPVNAPYIYSFPALSKHTFHGLPGLLADSLPDGFGNAVLNAWAARYGKNSGDISPLQRLQYIGKRGMGALEYAPATSLKHLNATQQVAIDGLLQTAQQVLDARQQFSQTLDVSDRESMLALLSVGTSAGGARPKAVLAFNEDFSEVRSGQVAVPEGFCHYLLKFDGVTEHSQSQETFGDPLGFGVMEYVYYLMAVDCGINMMPCRLLDEGPRRHFATQRFDRRQNSKVHVQTLTAMAHVDYRLPGSFSYAGLFGIARQLRLPEEDAEQLLKRMLFNLVARNHDDHAKNVAFYLDQDRWRLAPAYDLAYSYKPGSSWVNSHWMSLNGKRDDFTREDLFSLELLGIWFNRKRVKAALEEVCDSVARWSAFAKEWQVPKGLAAEVAKHLRLVW